MAEHGITVRDVARLEVARVGRVEETDDRVMPFRLLDDQGVEIAAVTEFLHHMLADDASAVSLRSYAYELLSCVPRNSGWLEVMVLGLTCGNASRHASEACL
jgi:hypothetical protein